MRAVFVAAALWACAANTAFAQVDPINWCPDGPSISAAPSGNALEQAFRVQRTTLVSATSFAPTDVVATLELAPMPRRRLATAREGLGIRVGELLLPMIILDEDTDVLQNYGVAYCATAAPTPGLDARLARYRNAACIVPSRDSDVATHAFPAMLNPPSQSGAVLTGRMALSGPGFGYGQEWGMLGEEAAPEAAISRNLRLGQVVISRSPAIAVWNRRAFTSVNVQFGVEGLQSFDRRLNQPLRIEDGWLVITGIADGGNIEIQRMTDTQWRSFQQERCAAA